MVKSQPLKIAVTCDDNYAEPAMMTLFSALSTLSTKGDVELHYFTLPDADPSVVSAVNAHLDAFKREFGATGMVHQVDIATEHSENWQKPKSAALFFRLYFSKFLAGQVLYLDPDLLVLGDVRENLEALDLGGHVFSAVLDRGLVRRVKKALAPLGQLQTWFNRFGVKQSAGARILNLLGRETALNYFNSGVMLIDLDHWETRECDAMIAKMGDIGQMPYRDQDALNLLARDLGGYALMSETWNVQSTKDNADALAQSGTLPLVRHYFGPRKPWLAAARQDSGSRLSWNKLYWQWQERLNAFRKDYELDALSSEQK